MLAYHGIGAYRGQRNPMSLRTMLNSVAGKAICGADRPIRAFGAVVAAPYAIAHDCDVWSERKERNDALNEAVPYDAIIKMSDLVDHRDRVIADEPCCNHPHHYCELWLRPTCIVALWVKPWTSHRIKRAAQVLARNRGLPLFTVNGTDKIWGVPITERYEVTAQAPKMVDIWPKGEIA